MITDLKRPYAAGTAISAYRFVKPGVDDDTAVVATAATDLIIGASEHFDVASGDMFDVFLGDIGKVKLGTGGTAAIVAANAANVASSAADATTRAVQQSQTVLADIMAAVKYTISDEGAAQREADTANTTRLVAAVTAPQRIAV